MSMIWVLRERKLQMLSDKTLFDDAYIFVRTCRDVSWGEELTDSYADLFDSVLERNKILKRGWNFECTDDVRYEVESIVAGAEQNQSFEYDDA